MWSGSAVIFSWAISPARWRGPRSPRRPVSRLISCGAVSSRRGKRGVPEGLVPAEIPPAVLKDSNLARDPVTFTPEKLRGIAPAPRSAAAELAHALALPVYASNNFAVSGARTTTGRPILANDPHRAHGVPGLRYFAHLSAPGLDVIGAGEPCLPGISLGHNGEIAFGITVFALDQEDLYVYETNPDRPDEYRYRDHWEPFLIRHETIEVKGEAPRTVVLKGGLD